MTSNLSREETEALLESHAAPTGARAQEVSARNFSRPHRLSRGARQRLARTVSAALPGLERSLIPWLREDLILELDEVTEVDALALFAELAEPFVVQALDVGGQQAWVVIPNESAQALAELALGVSSGSVERPLRPLSPIETGLVGDILLEIASGVARALDLGLEPGPLLQELRPLRLSLDEALARAGQRTALHIVLTGPSLPPATLRIYLPAAPSDGRGGPGERRPRPLPAHLATVSVDVSAQLGSIDVPLSDLLSLEVGDVVPLGVGDGEAATLFVEEQAAGHAQWGTHRGGLALRILDFQPPEEE